MSIIVEAAATFDGSFSQGHFAIPYFQIISNCSIDSITRYLQA